MEGASPSGLGAPSVYIPAPVERGTVARYSGRAKQPARDRENPSKKSRGMKRRGPRSSAVRPAHSIIRSSVSAAALSAARRFCAGRAQRRLCACRPIVFVGVRRWSSSARHRRLTFGSAQTLASHQMTDWHRAGGDPRSVRGQMRAAHGVDCCSVAPWCWLRKLRAVQPDGSDSVPINALISPPGRMAASAKRASRAAGRLLVSTCR